MEGTQAKTTVEISNLHFILQTIVFPTLPSVFPNCWHTFVPMTAQNQPHCSPEAWLDFACRQGTDCLLTTQQTRALKKLCRCLLCCVTSSDQQLVTLSSLCSLLPCHRKSRSNRCERNMTCQHRCAAWVCARLLAAHTVIQFTPIATETTEIGD